jgi:hypothetical protein
MSILTPLVTPSRVYQAWCDTSRCLIKAEFPPDRDLASIIQELSDRGWKTEHNVTHVCPRCQKASDTKKRRKINEALAPAV